MGEPPSRNPSDYSTTTHFKQRLKYRDEPPITPELVGETIQNGIYSEDGGPHAKFKYATEIAGKPHEITVGVNPDTMVALTCFCYCHKGDIDCRPHQFTDRY